ncbi:hypothetical protein D0809_21205 [Flavobacterium circumlabens]|uniref:Carboxypeptidase-like regulatory domain-containing protein n=1 Tax=Flavobacterium circumlabens TaxID=2133765 RepID=A0A4Y7U7L8_9FLAO|nr:hypothetical protein [Flavobacterium circumlabens]TCN53027.1 hypothetical protein EV142_10910 [Flavobacterium circumlabens]TEB42415.1 hypothetical protein D0809_21205 [Flavobacterium circumlabens]
MKAPLLFFFLLLTCLVVEVTYGQAGMPKKISGKILIEGSNALLPQSVTILNSSSQTTSVTDEKGTFSIFAKEGDVLFFSAVNLEAVRRIVTAEDLKGNVVFIKMAIKSIELKEVAINKHPNITAESMGIIPYGMKKYTPAERKLYTASSGGDALLNMFSGRADMLEKELKVEEKERLYAKIEYLFEDSYYTERLHIPNDYIRDFKIYCIEDTQFVKTLQTKDRDNIMFLMTDLAQKYLRIITGQ